MRSEHEQHNHEAAGAREQRRPPPPHPSSYHPVSPPDHPPDVLDEEAPKAKPQPPRKLGLRPEYTTRGRAARDALRAAAPDASAAEGIIYDLVGDQMAIAMGLIDAQAELVTRLGCSLSIRPWPSRSRSCSGM